jgi:hypothetical protein
MVTIMEGSYSKVLRYITEPEKVPISGLIARQTRQLSRSRPIKSDKHPEVG